MKNEIWLKVGGAIAASLMTYLVLNYWVTSVPEFYRPVVVAGVALIALGIAFWGGRKSRIEPRQKGKATIGSNIKAKGNIVISGIATSDSKGKGTVVGENLKATGDVEIKDIKIE